jgi:hypothetical protein
MTHNMSEAEKKALSAINEALNRYAANVLEVQGYDPMAPYRHQATVALGVTDKDGDPIQFDLKPSQHTHLYYEVNKGTKKGTRHCYTPWKDTKGRYWTFTYKPVGPGSRSGKAAKFKMADLVSFKKRKLAKKRALDRFYRDGGRFVGETF